MDPQQQRLRRRYRLRPRDARSEPTDAALAAVRQRRPPASQRRRLPRDGTGRSFATISRKYRQRRSVARSTSDAGPLCARANRHTQDGRWRCIESNSQTGGEAHIHRSTRGPTWLVHEEIRKKTNARTIGGSHGRPEPSARGEWLASRPSRAAISVAINPQARI